VVGGERPGADGARRGHEVKEINLSERWTGKLDFQCPIYNCPFHRTFSTQKGLRRGLALHLREHGLRVRFTFMGGDRLSTLHDQTRREATP
jgi:hypothetical protein